MPLPKHLFSIHTTLHFVKRFLQNLKKLSHHSVDGQFSQKADHQAVGKTYDLCAAVTVAPVHAVMVGTVGLGDGNLTVSDSDYVMAAFGGINGELLIDAQIHGFQNSALAGDLSKDGGFFGPKDIRAQSKAENKHGGKEKDPGFCFH